MQTYLLIPMKGISVKIEYDLSLVIGDEGVYLNASPLERLSLTKYIIWPKEMS